MIQEAKGNMRRNGFYFLLWGWVIVVANLGMYVLQKFDVPYPYAMWLITIPAWIISFVRGYREGKAQRIVTHLDTVTMWGDHVAMADLRHYDIYAGRLRQ
jgi:hypothetical protein